MNRTGRLLVLALLVVPVLAACSGGSAAVPPGIPPAPGGEAFYLPPAPAPGAKAGDVVWARPVDAPDGAEGFAFVYWSTGLDGGLLPVSAVLFRPTGGTAPAPVVAYAHGTEGLADSCAPSHRYQDDDLGEQSPIVAAILGTGRAFVATDYRGLGTPGEHPYLVNRAAGRDVLDSLRAARAFLGGSSPSVALGESQGADAALAAAEQAPSYARDIDLRGSTGLGVPASLNDLDESLSGGPYAGYALMALFGYGTVYPELERLDGELTPEGSAALAALPGRCGLDILRDYQGQPMSRFGADRVLNSPPFVARLAENSPGARTTVPVLLLHGERDDTIPVRFARELRARYCADGTPVQMKIYPDGGHVLLGMAANDVLAWMDERLRGAPVTVDCGPGRG